MPGTGVVLYVFLGSLFLLCVLALVWFILAMMDYTRRSRMIRKLTRKLPNGIGSRPK